MMSVQLKSHVHDFPELEVYPRVHYFYRRFRDLLTRYKRVQGALPKCLHDGMLMSSLDQLNESLDCGVRVYVIGEHDIDDSKLMFSSPSLQKQTETVANTTPEISLAVWHFSIENLGKKELQGIKTSFKRVSAYTKKLGLNMDIFIMCDVDRQYSKEEISEVQKTIVDELNKSTLDILIPTQAIFVDYDGCNVNTAISDNLEAFIANGFLNIYFDLKRFEPVPSEGNLENKNVLEIETVVMTITEFLSNAYTNVEVDTTKETEEKVCSVILQNLLHSLCRLIRCTLANIFGKRIGLKTWVCNALLYEIKFETALDESISKNSHLKHHLRKLATSTYQARCDGIRYTKKCNRYDFICSLLQTDMKPVVEKAEQKLLSMRRVSTIMRRMAFETNGYLKQTNIDDPEQNILPPAKKVTDVLRNALLHIPGVYGLGTIFGELEIHLDKVSVKSSTDVSYCTEEEIPSELEHYTDAKQQSCSSRIDNDPKTRLKTDIAKTLQEYQYRGPYSVKYVQNKPGEMVANYQPGDKLLREGKMGFGTLGGFIFSANGMLHGLTCGHVVGNNINILIDKSGQELLSCCSKVVSQGDGNLKHIDIAALEILPTLQSECKRSLENCSDNIIKVKLAEDHPEKIIGNTVYKYGAATGRTEGFVVSADYSVFGMDTKDYLVMIDTVPDIPFGFNVDFSSLTIEEDRQVQPQRDEGNNAPMETENTSRENPHHNADNVENMDMVVCASTPQRNDNSSEQGCGGKKKKKYDDKNSSETKYCEGNTIVQRNNNIYSESEEETFLHVEASHSGEEQSKDIHLSLRENVHPRLGSNKIFRHPLVYVRRSKCCLGSATLPSNESEIHDDVFAKGGDSGSIICIPEPTRSTLDCLALSMLSAGDFTIEGDESQKCLSFKLNVGLHSLMQQHDLEF